MPKSVGERAVRGSSRDHHAAGHRDQQRRNHGDQAVADGQHRVGLQRFLEGNALLEDADQKAGNDVDGGDQDRGQRIALIEAGRAVHGAVEFRFVRNLLAAGAGLHFVDQAGVQVGVDRHLLAGHGIQGEARRDFRGAHRAVADHDVLDRDQGQEQHEADNVIAAHDELAEGLNHASRRRSAFRAMQQNSPAAGQIE